MPVEQLSQYLPAVKPGREKAMRMPGGDVLLRFQQAGMSIDWWASGKGGMDAPESMAKSRSLADQLEEIALKVRDVQLDELRSKVRAVDQDAARLPF